MLIPYALPHNLTLEDFEDERSLSEWMEIWFGGFDDDVMDELYVEAQSHAGECIGIYLEALCDVEIMLTADQRLIIWRKLIGC